MRLLPTILLTIGLVNLSHSLANDKLKRGINGGLECATCTVLASMIEQLAEVNNQTIIQSVDSLCEKLPGEFNVQCQLFSEAIGPLVIEIVAESISPDDLCRALGLCFTGKGQVSCALYPNRVKLTPEQLHYFNKRTQLHVENKLGITGPWDICDLPGIKWICFLLQKTYDDRLPFEDGDGDYHSVIDTLRGASWRGKDCDDARNDVYPGRRPELLKDSYFDSNCNGIWGVNPKTKRPYEEELCEGQKQMGVAVFGDSVGAHFHAPEEWFSPPLLTKESLKPLGFAIGNELDWPQLSLVTGYMDSIWNITKGPVDSIYRRLHKHNHCIHRDYQNMAYNGDDSFGVLKTIKKLQRNPKSDYPLFVVLELVGNDVCNNHPDTLAHMTTDEQMHDNLIKVFDSLNSSVPAGSKVLIVGMADGDFLYQFLHNRTHPFGRWRNDLTYAEMYTWWNCMQVGPCNGWLNTNATLRKLTTVRAVALSKVMSNMATNYKNHWANLELNYVKCPIVQVITEYLFEHGPASGYQLIEPVDGFHPNQLGMALSAANVWKFIEDNLGDYFGPENGNNTKIEKLFGLQGGY